MIYHTLLLVFTQQLSSIRYLNLLFQFHIDLVGIAGLIEFLLGIVISAIAGVYLENKLRIMFFFKKLSSYILNSDASISVSFLFKGNRKFSIAKEINQIKDVLYKDDKDWRVHYKSDYKIVYRKNDLEIVVIVNPDSTVIIEAPEIPTTMRRIKDTFNSISDVIDKISRSLTYELSQVEFKAKLPYYQEGIAQFYIPRHFEVKDYIMTMSDKKSKMELKLIFGVLVATNDNISQLKTVFDRVLAF